MRIYFNTSALNRPFDDLSVPRIRAEADAVAMLIDAVEAGGAQLVSSEYSVFEVSQNPDPERARRVSSLLALGRTPVHISPRLVNRARELERFGMRGLDALHVAAAEAGRADVLVTTDDRLVRSARRAGEGLAVSVLLPAEALALLVQPKGRS